MLKAGIEKLDEYCSEKSCPLSVHHWRTQMMDELLSMKASDKEERERARGRHEVSREVHRAVAAAHAAELLRLRDKGELNDVTYMDLLLELDRENPEYQAVGSVTHAS